MAEVSLCFWGPVDLPAPSLCAFSKGSFQTGSLVHEHPEGVPVPWSPLGSPGFLFQGNIFSTVLHGHVSPSPPVPSRGTCIKWRCPKEGFPVAGLGTPRGKNTFREDGGGREGHGQASSSLSAAGLQPSAAEQRGTGGHLVLSAGVFSREGFPEGLMVGLMQSLQLSSAETFVIEIFLTFLPSGPSSISSVPCEPREN